MELNTIMNMPWIGRKPGKGLKAENISAGGNRIFRDLLNEAGEDVHKYLAKFKFLKSDNVILISSVRHYLYDSKDLEHVDAIINLRTLNTIRHLRYFLRTMNQLLTVNGYFVGCFMDYNSQKEEIRNKPTTLRYIFLLVYMFVNRVMPRTPVLRYLKASTYSGRIKCLTAAEVVELIEENGFKVIDLKPIDGCTYFVCQKTEEQKMRSKSILRTLYDYKAKSKIINV